MLAEIFGSSQAAENRTHQSLGTPVSVVQRQRSIHALVYGHFGRRSDTAPPTPRSRRSWPRAWDPKHTGGSICVSGLTSSLTRFRQRSWFRTPSVVRCTPGPCPSSRCESIPHLTQRRPIRGTLGTLGQILAVLGSASHARPVPNRRLHHTSIVLAEIGWSPSSHHQPTLSNERVSAARMSSAGSTSVSSRASNPSVSLSHARGTGITFAPRLRQAVYRVTLRFLKLCFTDRHICKELWPSAPHQLPLLGLISRLSCYPVPPSITE